MDETRTTDLELRIAALERQNAQLVEMLNDGRFDSVQVFRKIISAFRLRLKEFPSNPTSANEGEIAYVNGRLVLCTVGSATSPTWVVVGTQT